jgi:hypothetical protein
MKADLKDMIRDELYGADAKEVSELHMRDGRLCVNGKWVICIAIENIREIAKRIAKRATIGH